LTLPFEPLGGISTGELATLALIYTASYFIKGAFGFGQLTPIILLSAWIVEPHYGVLLALVTSAAAQIQFVPEAIRNGNWGIARPLLVGNFAGAAVGIWIFGNLDPAVLMLVLGAALGTLIAADVLQLFERLGKRVDLRSREVTLSLSGIAGMITGVTGAGGFFFMALYLKQVTTHVREFRATTLMVTALMVAWRTIVLAASGFITPQLLVDGITLLPCVVLGSWVGTRCFSVMTAGRFYRGIQALLIFVSLTVIWRALSGIGA
jgi:uncharacterized protein